MPAQPLVACVQERANAVKYVGHGRWSTTAPRQPLRLVDVHTALPTSEATHPHRHSQFQRQEEAVPWPLMMPLHAAATRVVHPPQYVAHRTPETLQREDFQTCKLQHDFRKCYGDHERRSIKGGRQSFTHSSTSCLKPGTPLMP